MADRPPTFNELLIREVQNHPELYDQQHRVCTDNEERNMMWEVIARRIDDNVTGEFAKKRWLQMRDRYRKELKMALRNMTQPKWPYFEKLCWLDPYLKDSKSAGLHPPFLGGQFEAENTPLMETFNQLKENVRSGFASNASGDGEVVEFPYNGAVNASALLENIMAASSSAFEQLQHRDAGEFSPDSAIASTSDDGDHQSHNNNRSSSTTASETGSTASTTNHRAHSASPDIDPTSHKSEELSQSDSGLNTENLGLDPNLLSLTNSDGSLSFMSTVLRGLGAVGVPQAGRQNSRSRNPPYLVRRGGGIKIKQERLNTELRHGFSSFKPLSKTMSVGGLSQLGGALASTNNLDRENGSSSGSEDARLPEWATDEDVLFARLIAVRLKKFAAKDKRLIRSRISEILDEKEEQVELIHQC